MHLVSGVGRDEFGDRALTSLRDHGVRTGSVNQSPDRPTGMVNVKLDQAGKPQFTIGPDAAWDHLAWTDGLAELAGRCDAVYFGTLGQRSPATRSVIRRFLKSVRAGVVRILDVNLRAPHFDAGLIRESVSWCTILKLSEEELPQVAGAMDITVAAATEPLVQLQQQAGLKAVAMTCGADGAVLLANGQSCRCPGVPSQVRDTVGAGDSFTAALTVGWLRGLPLEQIGRHACQVAAYVCSQDGATPALPASVRHWAE